MPENKKIALKEVKFERWRYVLYESDNNDFYIDVSYSPVSFVDACMLIKLTEEEKQNHLNESEFLNTFSEKIAYYFKDYIPRSLDHSDFNFINKKIPES